MLLLQENTEAKIFFINRSELNDRIDPIYYNSVNDLSIVKETIYPVKKLGEVVTMQRGRFGHRPRNDPKFYGGAYPFIQTGNIVEASKTNERIKYTQTLNELGLLTSRLFQPNVLVITIAANIGDTAILDYPACFPDSLVALIPKTDISIYYLNFYLKFLKPYIENLAPQAAQKNINNQQLSPIPIVVPPIEVQEQIAILLTNAYASKQQKESKAKELLISVDTYILSELGITLPERTVGLDSRIFTSLFSEVAGVRFDPLYIKNKGTIESKIYPNYSLRQIATISKGQSITKEKISAGTYPVIAGGQTSPYSHNEYNFEGNVITVSASGAYSGFVWYHDYKIFASDCIVVQSKNERQIYTHFIYHVMKALQGEIYKLQQGAGQPHVYARDLEKVIIPTPFPDKQKEMLNHINDIHKQIKKLHSDATAILETAKREVEKMILGR